MTSINRKFEAYLDEMDIIAIIIPRSLYEETNGVFTLHQDNKKWDLEIINCEEFDHFKKYSCKVHAFIEIGEPYIVKNQQGIETDLQIGAVIRTTEFDEAFSYMGEDLGVSYQTTSSVFKVWAPTATAVNLLLIYPKIKHKEQHQMIRDHNGVWTLKIQGDLEGVYYKYDVCVNLIWRDAVDPYVNAEIGRAHV